MKLNYRRTILIGLAFLSISSFWQMYDNVIPLILQDNFGLKETVTGVIMALDNILALFLLPLFGTLSDRVDTPIGKRMPFITGGTVCAVVFMMVLMAAVHTQNLAFFITILLLLLISMGLYRSPAVALMPDLTPAPLRSKANAVINLMGAVGCVYTLVMIKVLSPKNSGNYFPIFLAVAAFMFCTVFILFLTVHEKKTAESPAAPETAFQESPDDSTESISVSASGTKRSTHTKMDPAVKRSMIFLLLSISLWYTAYNAVTTAFSRYTQHVWAMKNGGYASCLMVGVVASIISYIPIGQISSRIGRKKTILSGIVIMTVCYLAGAFMKEYTPAVNVLFALIGFGWASINVNSYPMVVEMSREGDIGKFTGMYYTFSMAAQIVTPILSGFLLEHVSYSTLFPYAVCFSVLAFITMSCVHHGDNRPDAKSALESIGDASDD